MSNAELPRSVDPHRMAETGAELTGTIPLAELTRFRDAVLAVPEGGVCRVHLVFSADSQRRRIVRGELEADVELQCQRCMGSMGKALRSSFELGLVSTDERARQLPAELEPFITGEDSADLWPLVEDELLLALPSYPLHEREECPATSELEALEPGSGEDDKAGAESGEHRENPFKVLEGLKKTRH
ncbi:YceD family protein [Marinobacter sp. AN1]|nr:YceD family protein [Marinobacter sp. AN1]